MFLQLNTFPLEKGPKLNSIQGCTLTSAKYRGTIISLVLLASLASLASPGWPAPPDLFLPKPAPLAGFAMIQVQHLDVVHPSSLSTSFCNAFQPSSRSTFLPNLVSSTNLLRLYFLLSLRSLIKILNKTVPGAEPLETLPVFGHQSYLA